MSRTGLPLKVARIGRLMVLYSGVVAAAILLGAPTPDAPQLASRGCAKCREDCVAVRESCKKKACSDAGGRDDGRTCNNVKNHKAYVDGLAACGKQETPCWDRCQQTACK